MNESIERPEVVDDAMLDYLDELRESGVTNMFGAGAYLEAAFDLSRQDARTVLSYWMRTFGERQTADRPAVQP